jgi:hypothetical protein
MQKAKNFLLSILPFIVFTFLGIAFSIAVGFLIVVLNDGGAFNSWKLLDDSLRFYRIVDANSRTVWAKNKDDKLFYYKDIKQAYCDNNDCNKWIETKDVSGDAHYRFEHPVEKDTSCHFDDLMFLRKPPGTIIECARGWYAGPEFGTVSYYALLNDGTIWKWEHNGDNLLYTVMFLCLIPAGLILGIYGLTVFRVQSKKNKAQHVTT